jgi:hypothetical protein
MGAFYAARKIVQKTDDMYKCQINSQKTGDGIASGDHIGIKRLLGYNKGTLDLFDNP